MCREDRVSIVVLETYLQGGPVPPFRKTISRVGHAFAKLVLSNYYQDYITASDVSDFLEVRLKHLPKIEAAVFQIS